MKMSREGNSIRKERSVMTLFAVIVLSALTIMGIYMKSRKSEVRSDDGYTIDFSALKERASQKMDEINAVPELAAVPETEGEEASMLGAGNLDKMEETDGELDYAPLEAGSDYVQIKGITDKKDRSSVSEQVSAKDRSSVSEQVSVKDRSSVANQAVTGNQTSVARQASIENQAAIENQSVMELADPNMVSVVSSPSEVLEEADFGGLELHYSPEKGLAYPAQGDILMHFSMDKSIYFTTLDQYRYNPAVIFSVDEGRQVYACADGKVVDIHEDPKLGLTLTLDLGDGYLATYGQLHNLAVLENNYVNEGDALGFVNAPTKYYSLEGSNLYFQLTKDGEPVNPEAMFR